MHLARLLNYEIHDVMARWYLRRLEKKARPKYNKVTWDQVLEADTEIWKRLAQETRRLTVFCAHQQGVPVSYFRTKRSALRRNIMSRGASFETYTCMYKNPSQKIFTAK